MAECAWETFLSLFFTALRGEDGSSVQVQVRAVTPPAVGLTFRFQLIGGHILVGHFTMGLATPVPQEVPPALKDYLDKLRSFMVEGAQIQASPAQGPALETVAREHPSPEAPTWEREGYTQWRAHVAGWQDEYQAHRETKPTNNQNKQANNQTNKQTVKQTAKQTNKQNKQQNKPNSADEQMGTDKTDKNS